MWQKEITVTLPDDCMLKYKYKCGDNWEYNDRLPSREHCIDRYVGQYYLKGRQGPLAIDILDFLGSPNNSIAMPVGFAITQVQPEAEPKTGVAMAPEESIPASSANGSLAARHDAHLDNCGRAQTTWRRDARTFTPLVSIKYVSLQDGKGLEIEDGDLGLLKLNLEGRMKDNFNMKLGCEGIKDMYFNKGLGKKLTREEENAMSLLRSGDDDDPQLEAYRPKASEESISAFPSPASLTLPERDGGERVEGGSQTWRLGLHYANGANGPTESQLTFLEALTPHLKEAFVKQGVCLEVLTDNPDHLMGIVICRDYTSRTEIRAFSQAILSGFTAHAEALGLSDGAVDTESLAQCPYACLPIWFVTVWTTKPDSQPGIPLNVAKDISRAWPHGPVYDHVIRRNRDGTLHMADLPRHFFDRIAETAVSEERRRNHQKVGARLWCAA